MVGNCPIGQVRPQLSILFNMAGILGQAWIGIEIYKRVEMKLELRNQNWPHP